jgi:multidrug resistance efflux pump
MDSYQNTAEQLLRELAQLKSQERALQADIKAVQALLTHHVENADLDHLKTEAENTYRFEDTNFVYSPGRITWKYDDCNDVIAAHENLKELEETARAVGAAQRKQGTPFWSVR